VNDRIYYLDEEGNSLRNRRGRARTELARDSRSSSPKNALIPFSLSLWFWGLGDMVAEKLIRAGLLMISWITMHAVLVAVVIAPRWWINRLIDVDILPPAVSVGIWATGYYLLSLFSPLLAYQASKRRGWRLQAVDLGWLIVAASILTAGWGQWLNGQSRKGSFMLAFGIIPRAIAVLLVWSVCLWPHMLITDRAGWEIVWIAAACTLPLGLLAYLCAFYDAVAILRHPGKRDSWITRVRFALNRTRMGHGIGVVRELVRFLVMIVILVGVTVGAIMIGPWEHYSRLAQSAGAWAKEQGLVKTPIFLISFSEEMERIQKLQAQVRTKK